MTPDTRQCTECKLEKPLEAFDRSKLGKYGRYPKCKECCRVYLQAYYKRNREEMSAKRRRWYQDNRESALEKSRQWERANPEKCRELEARYRARERAATVGTVSYKAILERDGLTCHICSEEVDPSDIHFDHVIPLSRGGAHSMDNIRVAHSRCNLSKGAKMPEELYA